MRERRQTATEMSSLALKAAHIQMLMLLAVPLILVVTNFSGSRYLNGEKPPGIFPLLVSSSDWPHSLLSKKAFSSK